MIERLDSYVPFIKYNYVDDIMQLVRNNECLDFFYSYELHLYE